jgi:replicative DNA helicase
MKTEIPPDIYNEVVVLGNIIQNKDALKYAMTTLKVEMLTEEKHKTLFWALSQLENKEVNLDTLHVLCESSPHGSNYGGKNYFLNLQSHVKENQNYRDHIEKVRTDWVKRNFLEKSVPSLVQHSLSPKTTVDQLAKVLKDVEMELFSGGIKSTKVLHGETLKKTVWEAYNTRARTDLVLTTFQEIDEVLTECFMASKISVVGARPGMGKSAFIATLIERILGKYKETKFFWVPPEMGSVSSVDRILSMKTDLELFRFYRIRSFSEDDLYKIKYAMEEFIKDDRIFVYDERETSLEDVVREFRMLQINHGPNNWIVVIDLVDELTDIREASDTPKALHRVLRKIRSVAGSRGQESHWLLVAQVNKVVEERENKRPRPSDLYYGDAWLQIADLVFLLYRDKYYNPTNIQDTVEIIIGKQRQGRQGESFILGFDSSSTKIYEPLTGEEDLPL